MRVTANITSDNALYNIQQGRTKLDKISEQTSSGNNVNRPSDDPINTRLLLDVGDQVKTTDQFSSNIGKANTWQQVTNTALTGISDTMTLAKQLMDTLTSGTSDATTRQTAISQLQAMKQQVVDMGNTQFGDQYIFGGAKNTSPPFSPTGPNYYSGDESALKVEIATGSTQQINIPGNQLLTADTATAQPYGSTNILQTFDNLIAAVGANNVTAITQGAQAMEAGIKQVQNATGDVASRVARLDSMSKLNKNSSTMLNNIYSNVQNVDYAKLAVELSQQQTAFNASLSATAKISQLSLLDYM